jgi:hypothetical protein
MPRSLFRILASVILLLSVLFMPFWLTVILALSGMVYFSYFWEAAALLLLSDLLYGAPDTGLFGMVFISFIIAIIAILLVEFMKKKLKFYK